MPDIPRTKVPEPKYPTQRVTKATADIADVGNIGAGLVAMGKSFAGLAEKFQRVKDNTDTAKGITEYNRKINEYNESLAGRDPANYLDGYDEFLENVNQIPANIGMSVGAARDLQNKFAIWNEANRASIALLALKNKSTLARQEIPSRLAHFSLNDMHKEAREYIDGFSDIMGPKERELWKNKYVENFVNPSAIFRATNLAADNPTPKNLKAARAVIEKLSQTEEEKYFNLRRLRGLKKQKSVLKDAAYKARLNRQVDDMVGAFSTGKMYNGDVATDLEPIYNQFAERLSNDTLDASDDMTYESMESEILRGEYYDKIEMASAYSSGLSTDEYKDLVAKNDENAGLSIAQKESLSELAKYITTKYNKMLLGVSNKLSPTTAPEVMAAVQADTLKVKRMVKSELLKGTSTNEIYELIEKHFIADTDRFMRNWFVRMFTWGEWEFPDEVDEIGERKERHEVIMNMLKGKEETRKRDVKQLTRLLELWYD